MITVPELDGRNVRLEPLHRRHAAGLAEAAAADPSLYRLSPVPQGRVAAAGYIETALAQRDAGTTVPFAVVRAGDGTVIGSTRFFDLEWWPWPPDHPRHLLGDGPDTCEIGYTWLTAAAIGTAANTEMKLLMLRYAFETWQVASGRSSRASCGRTGWRPTAPRGTRRATRSRRRTGRGWNAVSRRGWPRARNRAFFMLVLAVHILWTRGRRMKKVL